MCVWPMFESTCWWSQHEIVFPILPWFGALPAFPAWFFHALNWSTCQFVEICRDPTLISVTVSKVHHSGNPRNVTIPVARQFVLRCVVTFGNCLRWKLHGWKNGKNWIWWCFLWARLFLAVHRQGYRVMNPSYGKWLGNPITLSICS